MLRGESRPTEQSRRSSRGQFRIASTVSSVNKSICCQQSQYMFIFYEICYDMSKFLLQLLYTLILRSIKMF